MLKLSLARRLSLVFVVAGAGVVPGCSSEADQPGEPAPVASLGDDVVLAGETREFSYRVEQPGWYVATLQSLSGDADLAVDRVKADGGVEPLETSALRDAVDSVEFAAAGGEAFRVRVSGYSQAQFTWNIRQKSRDEMLTLAQGSGCFACHSLDEKVVGPSWRDIALRYTDDGNARPALIDKVKNGGDGNWSDVTQGVAMPPYAPRVSDKHVAQLVDFILSLGAAAPAAQMPPLARHSGCTACHAIDITLVGPAWRDIARRYKGDPAAVEYFVQKIKEGGQGKWTEVTQGASMPPYSPRVSDSDIRALAELIVSLE